MAWQPEAGNYTLRNVATDAPLIITSKSGLSFWPTNDTSVSPSPIYFDPRNDTSFYIRISQWKFTWCLSAQWLDSIDRDDKAVKCVDERALF